MRILLIFIIGIHSLIEKLKSRMTISSAMQQADEEVSSNAFGTFNESDDTIPEEDNDRSSEESKKYIVPNESIIGTKIIFLSTIAMAISIFLSFEFVHKIDQSTPKENIRTLLLIDDYFAPLWQSCNLALTLYLGNDNIGRYVKQYITLT